MSAYEKKIANYPGSRQSINARFEKLFAYINIKKDSSAAKEILSGIKLLNLTDDESSIEIAIAESLLGLQSSGSSNEQLKNAGNAISVSKNTPAEYTLEQNYPNPFNPSTKIKYQIAKAGRVAIKVYNVLGQLVKELVNRMQEPGTYEVMFDGAKLSSGLYIYEIKSNEFTADRKMILLK